MSRHAVQMARDEGGAIYLGVGDGCTRDTKVVAKRGVVVAMRSKGSLR